MKHSNPSPTRQRGFTLVEVLVVVAIIALVMFAAMPNMAAVIRGSKLTQAADQIRFDLAIAQQIAIKENIPVEVRFYQIPDNPDFPSDNIRVYTAYQAFQLMPDLENYYDPTMPRVYVTIDGVKKLPNGVAIPESQKWATLMTKGEIKKGTEQVRGLVQGQKRTEANYCAYQINPDGQTNLDKRGRDQWFFTLMEATTIARASSADELDPDNYIVLQIEPYSGSVRVFQPN